MVSGGVAVDDGVVAFDADFVGVGGDVGPAGADSVEAVGVICGYGRHAAAGTDGMDIVRPVGEGCLGGGA